MTNIWGEEFVDRTEAAPGKQFLAGNARQAVFQKSEECDFAVGARREIGGAAFGGSGAMAVAVPVKNGFAETCARRDDGDVVLRMVHTAIKKKKIFGTEFLQAARGGDEVVHKNDTFVRQFE